MTTRLTIKETDTFEWQKHWITGGGVSKFHLIFARVYKIMNLRVLPGLLP
ncbi:MAG: hypothetical protein CM1200mP28_14240 [Deltaproteobacteria bacterium]|nr:MAG: hypothetical protein CM1200mP28_14240 [Deltaproteobacteria bacterium]